MAANHSRFDVAKAWHRALLIRELEARGVAGAAHYIDDCVRLSHTGTETERGTVAAAVHAPVGDYQLRLNAMNGETLSWYFDVFAKGGAEPLPESELSEIGRKSIQLPADATLEMEELEPDGPRLVYRMRWVHALDDIPIDEDYIEVLLNAATGKLFAVNRAWRTPKLAAAAEER